MQALKALPTLIFLLSLFAISCEEISEYPHEIYQIKKGEHYSTKKVASLQTRGIHFMARFDESVRYQNVDPVNQHDINKLLGFSDANELHHDNSARFGWRWLNDQIEIFGYVYNDGERISQYLGTVGIHEYVHYQLHIDGDQYVFSLGEQAPVAMPRTSKGKVGVYYMLYPYFGGDEAAPQDITITVRMVW